MDGSNYQNHQLKKNYETDCFLLNLLFTRDFKVRLSWQAMPNHVSEVGGSNHGAGKNESTKIIIYYYWQIAVPQLITESLNPLWYLVLAIASYRDHDDQQDYHQ